MNALANPQVAEYVNEHFIATYLRGRHVPHRGRQKARRERRELFLPVRRHRGPRPGRAGRREAFLSEARWALETRKAALTLSTKFATGEVNQTKFAGHIRKAHEERLRDEIGHPPPLVATRLRARRPIALRTGA